MNFVSVLLKGVAVLPSIVQGVEALFGSKTGAQKKDAALGLVSTAINVTDSVANKTIIDGTAFTAGLGQIVDGVVACLNASIWHKA
jgi:hypothetical protein